MCWGEKCTNFQNSVLISKKKRVITIFLFNFRAAIYSSRLIVPSKGADGLFLRANKCSRAVTRHPQPLKTFSGRDSGSHYEPKDLMTFPLNFLIKRELVICLKKSSRFPGFRIFAASHWLNMSCSTRTFNIHLSNIQ